MGIFEHWPYVNFHNLNLDWIIEKMKTIDERFENAQQYAETATEKAAEAEQSAAAADQSADLAQQSAEAAALSESNAAGSAATAGSAAADAVAPIQSLAQSVSDQIDVLTGQINTFMSAHAGPTGKTLLWSGSAYVPGTEIQLSDSVDNYTDFIVEAQNGSNTWQMIVRPEILKLVNGPEICLPAQAGVSPTAALRVGHILLGMDAGSTDVIKIRANNTWDWSGAADAAAAGTAVTSSATGPVMHINRIYGISNPQTNAEVEDIRVGADGTVYTSAGNAVRGQISELKSALSNSMPSAVKHALDAMLLNMVVKNDDVFRDEYNTFHTWAYAVNLLSISAVYTPSGAVYDTDSLDSLRSDLVVTASYDDGTSQIVTGYTLSGTLTEGTSTITVSYDGKTTTFNVTVESQWWTLEWDKSDGNYPYTVDSSHWTKVMQTSVVSFVTGKGVRFNGTGGTFSIYPTGYETSAKSEYEIVFQIDTMPTLNGIVLRLGNGTIGMQATFGNGGVSIDNGETMISGVSITTGVEYTAKAVCDTTGTCHLYLNGSEIWSGSASAIGNKKNYVMMTSESNMDAYISQIRFAPTA